MPENKPDQTPKTVQTSSAESMSKTNYQYNREEMVAMRELKLSRTRPAELSQDFDNEDGFFSPDKWLQHRWQCEGVENRGRRPKPPSISTMASGTKPLAHTSGTSKILNAIMEGALNNSSNEVDKQTVFSPQRRGFSSGCRASSPSKANDEEKPIKSRWKQGHLNNGVDFKPAFQKTALEATGRSTRNGPGQNNQNSSSGTGSWAMGGSTKHNYDKNRRYGDRVRRSSDNEPVPEWMNEAASHLDVIELKGFDDDSSAEKKRRRSRGKETKTSNNKFGGIREGSEGRAQSNSRPQSAGATNKRNSTGDISGPTSRQTPTRTSDIQRNSSKSPAAVKIIQASDLENSILKEQKEKMSKEKMDKTFDLFTALEMQPPSDTKTSPANKLPNSDAEFAAFILGVPTTQISKPAIGVVNSLQSNPAVPTSQQHQQPNQEPATSRLSRFFAKNDILGDDEEEHEKLGDLLAMNSTMTKSQLDLSTLNKAHLPNQNRHSFSPTGNLQPFPASQLRPASAELQTSARFQQQQQSPIRQLLTPTSVHQANKFPYASARVSDAEREALLQQMQAHLSSGGGRFFPQQATHVQLPPQFLEQFRKTSSPKTSPSTGPLFLLGGQSPSSTENPHQMLSSPNYSTMHQQQRLSPLQHIGPPLGSAAAFNVHFHQLLHQTARRMMSNTNAQPDPFQLRLAFEELRKDPKMFALINQMNNQQQNNMPPFPFGGMRGGTFSPAVHPSHAAQFIGGSGSPSGAAPFPFHHHHSMAASPNGGGPMPAPPHPFPHLPPHHFNSPTANGMPHPAAAAFFHQQQQQNPYTGIMNFPPPPQMLSQHHPIHQKTSSAAGLSPNPNLLNTPAFMPTSVMRQMSKFPGCSGSSVTSSSIATPELGQQMPNAQNMFLQKLFADAKTTVGGRAVLGRDPVADQPMAKNPTRVTGCLKLEDIEQRELAACHQQQSAAARNSSTAATLAAPP